MGWKSLYPATKYNQTDERIRRFLDKETVEDEKRKRWEGKISQLCWSMSNCQAHTNSRLGVYHLCCCLDKRGRGRVMRGLGQRLSLVHSYWSESPVQPLLSVLNVALCLHMTIVMPWNRNASGDAPWLCCGWTEGLAGEQGGCGSEHPLSSLSGSLKCAVAA